MMQQKDKDLTVLHFTVTLCTEALAIGAPGNFASEGAKLAVQYQMTISFLLLILQK